MMLEVKDLRVNYGNICALKGICLDVSEGEIVTLIGSNGAGKSTLLNSVIGLIPKAGGMIQFMGEDITGKGPHEIVRMGIGYSPEGRNVCQKLSVYENLEVGFFTCRGKMAKAHALEYVYDLFPILKERSHQAAGTLSGGEQQMLAIGRALMNSPKLLMMDEPSLGLAPALVKTIFTLICRIRESGVAILLIEQNASMALRIANRGYVLETGTVTLSDKCSNLLNNDDVRRAYLGTV